MYVLDTNICIHVLKHRDRRLLHKFRAIRHLGVSTVTLGELNYGIENGSSSLRVHRYEQLRLFTSQLTVLPWDEDAAQHYGVIRADLRKQGLMIGGNDLLIAAQARAASAVLVTNNTREFGRVPDLTVEDWLG